MDNYRITLDTHSLLWYMDKGQNMKLSHKALQKIEQAERNGTILTNTKLISKDKLVKRIGRDIVLW